MDPSMDWLKEGQRRRQSLPNSQWWNSFNPAGKVAPSFQDMGQNPYPGTVNYPSQEPPPNETPFIEYDTSYKTAAMKNLPKSVVRNVQGEAADKTQGGTWALLAGLLLGGGQGANVAVQGMHGGYGQVADARFNEAQRMREEDIQRVLQDNERERYGAEDYNRQIALKNEGIARRNQYNQGQDALRYQRWWEGQMENRRRFEWQENQKHVIKGEQLEQRKQDLLDAADARAIAAHKWQMALGPTPEEQALQKRIDRIKQLIQLAEFARSRAKNPKQVQEAEDEIGRLNREWRAILMPRTPSGQSASPAQRGGRQQPVGGSILVQPGQQSRPSPQQGSFWDQIYGGWRATL